MQVPVGGCYRLIDVPMSNCINSGIRKIFILTQFNSFSLNRHLARTYNFGNGVSFGDGFVEVRWIRQYWTFKWLNKLSKVNLADSQQCMLPSGSTSIWRSKFCWKIILVLKGLFRFGWNIFYPSEKWYDESTFTYFGYFLVPIKLWINTLPVTMHLLTKIVNKLQCGHPCTFQVGENLFTLKPYRP